MTGTDLSIWTIYDHPPDYPDYYVARLSTVGADGVKVTETILLCDNVDELRAAMLVRRLTRLHRLPEDDAKIMEVWL